MSAQPAETFGVWRETQGGWTVAIAEGVSANIRVTRKGKAAWTMILSGSEDTVAEAQAKLETLRYAMLGKEE